MSLKSGSQLLFLRVLTTRFCLGHSPFFLRGYTAHGAEPAHEGSHLRRRYACAQQTNFIRAPLLRVSLKRGRRPLRAGGCPGQASGFSTADTATLGPGRSGTKTPPISPLDGERTRSNRQRRPTPHPHPHPHPGEWEPLPSPYQSLLRPRAAPSYRRCLVAFIHRDVPTSPPSDGTQLRAFSCESTD